MDAHYRELTESEEALAVARAKGDSIINSALDWIDRFYAQCNSDLIQRLTFGIRNLSKAMHSRSVDEIVAAIDMLLRIQENMLYLYGSTALETSENTLLEVVPRVHEKWSKSKYFLSNIHKKCSDKLKYGPVFISYSRADSDWLNRVKVHLRPLERAGRIELWHDGMLQSGEPWREKLNNIVRTASSAIFLVSANFMASDFIYTNELQPIAKRARDGGVVVFPVVIGHCLFDEDDYLKDFQLFNDPELPLSRLESAEVDKILVDLARTVRVYAGELKENSV